MKRSNPSVTAVIVTYQSRKLIGAALDTIYDRHRTGFVSVIVVDNASSDGTADFVAERYPWVKLLRNETNVGFGRGCNRAIEHAVTPYMLLLNPDATLDSASLNELVAFMETHPRAGMCAPAILQAGGELQKTGGLPTPLEVALAPLGYRRLSNGRRSILPGSEPARTDWLCGAALLLRRTTIERIGGFDPRFFLYFEETDLCRRALEDGWELWTVGKAIARHIVGASAQTTGERLHWHAIADHYYRSRFYYLAKHFGLIPAIMADLGEVASMLLRTPIDLLRGRENGHVRLRLKAPLLQPPPAAGRVSNGL